MREIWRREQAKAAANGISWVPHTISITCSEGGQLSVREREEKESVRI